MFLFVLCPVVLTSPVCTSEGEKLALSRRVDKHWRLIGWGKIRKGTRIVQSSSASTVGVQLASSLPGDDDHLDSLAQDADRQAEEEGEGSEGSEEDAE